MVLEDSSDRAHYSSNVALHNFVTNSYVYKTLRRKIEDLLQDFVQMKPDDALCVELFLHQMARLRFQPDLVISTKEELITDCERIHASPCSHRNLFRVIYDIVRDVVEFNELFLFKQNHSSSSAVPPVQSTASGSAIRQMPPLRVHRPSNYDSALPPPVGGFRSQQTTSQQSPLLRQAISSDVVMQSPIRPLIQAPSANVAATVDVAVGSDILMDYKDLPYVEDNAEERLKELLDRNVNVLKACEVNLAAGGLFATKDLLKQAPIAEVMRNVEVKRGNLVFKDKNGSANVTLQGGVLAGANIRYNGWYREHGVEVDSDTNGTERFSIVFCKVEDPTTGSATNFARLIEVRDASVQNPDPSTHAYEQSKRFITESLAEFSPRLRHLVNSQMDVEIHRPKHADRLAVDNYRSQWPIDGIRVKKADRGKLIKVMISKRENMRKERYPRTKAARFMDSMVTTYFKGFEGDYFDGRTKSAAESEDLTMDLDKLKLRTTLRSVVAIDRVEDESPFIYQQNVGRGNRNLLNSGRNLQLRPANSLEDLRSCHTAMANMRRNERAVVRGEICNNISWIHVINSQEYNNHFFNDPAATEIWRMDKSKQADFAELLIQHRVKVMLHCYANNLDMRIAAMQAVSPAPDFLEAVSIYIIAWAKLNQASTSDVMNAFNNHFWTAKDKFTQAQKMEWDGIQPLHNYDHLMIGYEGKPSKNYVRVPLPINRDFDNFRACFEEWKKNMQQKQWWPLDKAMTMQLGLVDEPRALFVPQLQQVEEAPVPPPPFVDVDIPAIQIAHVEMDVDESTPRRRTAQSKKSRLTPKTPTKAPEQPMDYEPLFLQLFGASPSQDEEDLLKMDEGELVIDEEIDDRILDDSDEERKKKNV